MGPSLFVSSVFAMSKLPLVAIIGRPNVGKSTLYNRLTNTRAALVSDIPGLTRDRREGVADLGGLTVSVIDTAGLEDSAPGSIADRMRKQSEKAIEDADLILFVVDARAGVTPTDTAFARLLAENLRSLGETRFTSYPERLPEIIW